MDQHSNSYKIARNLMYENDNFSKWMGIEILDITDGYCQIKMIVREEMLNGFKICHGGVTYSFADSAFAFASNSMGRKAVSIETSISHTKSIKLNDALIATSSLKSKSKSLAVFNVEVANQNDEIVALFKGTVFLKEEWID